MTTNTKYSRQGSNKLDLCSKKIDEQCEGWLWIKEMIHLTHRYIKRWCLLKDKLLSIYTNKDGQLKNEINIEVCRITPIIKAGTKNFYFEINNQWYKHVFGTRLEDDYVKWLACLQHNSCNCDDMDNYYYEAQLFKAFDRDGSISIDQRTVTLDSQMSEDSYDLLDDLKRSHDNNQFGSMEIISNSLDDVGVKDHTSDSTENSSSLPEENVNSLELSLFRKVKGLEQEIREKSILLGKIDNILIYAHLPDQIELFFEEYYDQIIHV